MLDTVLHSTIGVSQGTSNEITASEKVLPRRDGTRETLHSNHLRRDREDGKSSQVSRTHLSILSDLNNALVWILSSPLISKSSNTLIKPLVIVQNAPITISIIVTFIIITIIILLSFIELVQIQREHVINPPECDLKQAIEDFSKAIPTRH